MSEMYDKNNLVRISCAVADIIRANPNIHPYSGYTNPEKLIYTEWGIKDQNTVVLKEYYWPQVEKDKCSHWAPNENWKKDEI